ncbi:MAG: DNA-3-methyladenine glycosylase I [Pseudohongiellaceae bacterium]
MTAFAKIRERAENRKGGSAALKKLMPTVLNKKKLAEISDDRYLAMMTKCINQAGFSWKVIEKKWPEFEEAFFEFKPDTLSLLSPEQWEAYTSDRRVVRNWQKIKALQENVFFVTEESRRHGGFGKFIGQWPESEQIDLMRYLKKHGSRLGGQSALWFLRRMGKDCFILATDVVVTLRSIGLDIAENPSSQRDLKKIQAQFNQWQQETGLPYSHLSRILACSVGENYL